MLYKSVKNIFLSRHLTPKIVYFFQAILHHPNVASGSQLSVRSYGPSRRFQLLLSVPAAEPADPSADAEPLPTHRHLGQQPGTDRLGRQEASRVRRPLRHF